MSLPHKEEASRNSQMLCWDVSDEEINYLTFEKGSVLIEIKVDFTEEFSDTNECRHGHPVRLPKITLQKFHGPSSSEELTSAQYFLFVGRDCTDMRITLTSGSITKVASGKNARNCVCACEEFRINGRELHFRLVLEIPGGLSPISDKASCDSARLKKFAQLFNNPDDSDVTIVTASGEEIKVPVYSD